MQQNKCKQELNRQIELSRKYKQQAIQSKILAQNKHKKWLIGESRSLAFRNEFQGTQRGKHLAVALSIDRCGGRVTAVSVVRVLKGDGERVDVNRVMSVRCKKLLKMGRMI